MRETITHGELKNGMKVWVQGHLFTVENIRVIPAAQFKPMHGGHDNNENVIRFTGRIEDEKEELYKTGYNGATYGAVASEPCTIEK